MSNPLPPGENVRRVEQIGAGILVTARVRGKPIKVMIDSQQEVAHFLDPTGIEPYELKPRQVMLVYAESDTVKKSMAKCIAAACPLFFWTGRCGPLCGALPDKCHSPAFLREDMTCVKGNWDGD